MTDECFNQIDEVLMDYPDILSSYTEISYSSFYPQYKSALVLAVPYEPQLTIQNYTEEAFEQSSGRARRVIDEMLPRLELVLKEQSVNYYIPPVAQSSEKELVAPFSFKHAATKAGIGWIGKNDVVITREYGPRIRLSAILLDTEVDQEIEANTHAYIKCQCSKECNICVSICPHHALKGTMWNDKKLREEIIDYQLCNQKRSLYIEEHGRKNSCGLCLVACPCGIQK